MISPEDLMSKIEQDDKNKIDLYPLLTELQYKCTTEDVAGTHDILIWNSPDGRQMLKFKEASRSGLIKDMGGADHYFVNKCDSAMRYANMAFIMGQYALKHEKLLVRCRNKSHFIPDLPKDLTIRKVCGENFVKFDNAEFVRAMLEPMDDHGMEIGQVDLTDDALIVRAYFEEDVSITEGKWTYRPGIMIVNSETGKHRPVVECIIENTVDPGIIRWPIEGDSLLSIDKSNVQAANLAKAVEAVPSEAYEQIELMEKRIRRYSKEKFSGDHTLQLYLLLRGAKVNDEGRYITDLVSHLSRYTVSGKHPVTKMHMVQAVARCARDHKNQKLARLAGHMLTQDSSWDNALAHMIAKRADKKSLAAAAATEEV